ncbi:MAG: 16S rRNA (cytosine(967)-C(5))-methyltransferase RsmB [Acidobacteriota bacterium]
MAVRSKARRLAYNILRVFEAGKPPLSILLENIHLVPLDSRELSLAYELIVGLIRWLPKIDHILSLYSNKPLESLDIPVRIALRLGVYQLLFLDRVPRHAAIDESVELAKSEAGRSGASYVNAVLREISREPDRITFPDREKDVERWLSIYYSHPEWLVSRWIKRFGPERTEELLSANNRHAPICIWVNSKVHPTDLVLAELRREEVEVVPSEYLDDAFIIKEGLPHRTGIFRAGGFYIQDEASQLIHLIFGKELSGKVADLCAAPGGKSLRMALAMGDRGFVVSVDASPSRINSLKENIKRMRVANIFPLVADLEEGIPLKEEFDFVLLDAPCSGTGVIRRNPDIKWRLREEEIVRLSARQFRMLNEAAKIVRQGGLLLYSVCSIEEEETDALATSFLKANPHFELEDPSVGLPAKARKFVDGGAGCETSSRTFFRTYPHRDNLDGFFASLFRRIAS